MALLANVLWLILGGGLVLALQYVLMGVLLCVTIIGIPFGLQWFKLAAVVLLPFGTEIQGTPRRWDLLPALLNILWLLLGGILLVLQHLVMAVVMALTIIGIPFALQHLKLTRAAALPFGTRVR